MKNDVRQKSGKPSTRNPLWRPLAAVVCLLVFSAGALPSGADLSGEIEKLKSEREEIKREQEEKAEEVDAATAETEELTAALALWNRRVNETEAKLEKAQAALEAANARLDQADAEVAAAVAAMDRLESEVAQRAVHAFIDQGGVAPSAFNPSEPTDATRAKTMVDQLTDADFDVAEELRALREDLEVKRARAEAARAEAEGFQSEIEADLVAVAEARDKQAELTAEAEARLERQLAEKAILDEHESNLSSKIDSKTKALAAQIAAQAASKNPAPTVAKGNYPTSSQLRNVRGFWVHEKIAGNLEAMLAHAARDGITFGGWAYRDHQAQIRLRRAHCGTSTYAIYSMSASRCRPPTARPGSSQHEYGLAIDFTYGGRSMGSRSNAGYKWLARNAGKYGFKNLPSEPWHWSTTGR